jgi:hypothetical protein
VTPNGNFLVSNALRDDWQNGRIHYELRSFTIRRIFRWHWLRRLES